MATTPLYSAELILMRTYSNLRDVNKIVALEAIGSILQAGALLVIQIKYLWFDRHMDVQASVHREHVSFVCEMGQRMFCCSMCCPSIYYYIIILLEWCSQRPEARMQNQSPPEYTHQSA